MKYILCMILWGLTWLCFADTGPDPFEDNQVVVSYDKPYLTLHAQDAPMAVVLERVAKAVGENIIVQGEFTEPVTLHLNRVSANQILLALCDTFQLSAVKRNGYLWVGKASTDHAGLATHVFSLKYSRAISLQKIFDKQGVLSDVGSVRVDERTNALVITDDDAHLLKATELLKTLDIPVKQIFIQARILNASKGFSKSLGVSFSAKHDKDEIAFQGRNPAGDFGQFQITLAKIGGGISLDSHISAAEKNNQTEVLAMPKILTADQQNATIKQGKELAYEETATSGATSVRFKEAVLELSVTPHITPNHDIILDLHVKHDVIGKLAENGQPTIDTQAIHTQVRLHDGETIVLGGIYSNRHLNQRQDVPVLSKIPLLGHLFKDRYREDDKNELLVFVTPTIIEE